MKIHQGFDAETKRACLDLQQMSAMPAVVRKEVEVIAGNTEGAREAGGPQADQRAVDPGELELALGFCCIDEACAGRRRIDRARRIDLK